MNSKEFWLELAKKLAPVMAFAILVLLVIALLGERIPPGFQALVYIVVIGALLVYAFSEIQAALARQKASQAPPAPAPAPLESAPPVRPETPAAPGPAPAPPAQFGGDQVGKDKVGRDAYTAETIIIQQLPPAPPPPAPQAPAAPGLSPAGSPPARCGRSAPRRPRWCGCRP